MKCLHLQVWLFGLAFFEGLNNFCKLAEIVSSADALWNPTWNSHGHTWNSQVNVTFSPDRTKRPKALIKAFRCTSPRSNHLWMTNCKTIALAKARRTSKEATYEATGLVVPNTHPSLNISRWSIKKAANPRIALNGPTHSTMILLKADKACRFSKVK